MKQKKSEGVEKSSGNEKITRKEALKKAGYIAFSAATMLILLNQPGKAQDTSLAPDNPDAW